MMNRYERYMNDPEIVSEPMPSREVHAIRLMIYDDIKDMTKDERRAYYAKGLAEAQTKYELNIVSLNRK
jgi:hypothetical protein